MRLALVVAMFALAASGCLGAVSKGQQAELVVPAVSPLLAFDGKAAGVGELVAWKGRHLRAEPSPFLPYFGRPVGSAPACSPSSCERVLFRLENTTDDLVLRIMASWPFSTREGDADLKHPGFSLSVILPDGATRQASESTYGALLIVPAPKPGTYQLTVRIDGIVPLTHAYDGFMRLDRQPAPTTAQLLPDLALMYIGDLQLAKSLPGDYSPATVPAPWTKGCGVDEFQEHRSMRCLRFTASIANVGDGPLMLFFEDGDGTVPVHQCIVSGDGGTITSPAGTGAWHDAHAHHHHSDVVDYKLYKYDLASQTRGEPATKGQKFGWGFAAQGVMPHVPPETYTKGRVFFPPREECPAFTKASGGAYGLPKGWHDPYLFWRNGNYVDITNVGDGVYELEIVLDMKDNVLETDRHANTGSVLLRIRGDNVEQLTTYQRDFAPAP